MLVALLLDVDIAVICLALSQDCSASVPSSSSSAPSLTPKPIPLHLRKQTPLPAPLLSATSSVTFSSNQDLHAYHQAGFPVDFPVLPAILTRAGVTTYLPSDVPSDPLATHQHAAKAAYITQKRLAPSPVQISCPEPEILTVHQK